MTELMNMKKAKRMGASMSLSFLLIHIFLLILFTHYNVRPMAYFNIFSILFYFCSLVLLKKEWLRVFVMLVYLEILAHMSAAVYFTGWDNGFQNSIIGLSILLFYSEYIGRSMKIPHLKSLPISFIGLAAYLISYIVNHRIETPYPLPENVSFFLQIFWGVVVFSITIFFMYLFVNLTTESDAMLTRKAGHDQLTGLPNRYYISDYLHTLKSDAGLDGHWAAMVDIDDFKKINDTYGHNCGDYILKELSTIMLENRTDITVCRWGGEEFLLIGKLSPGTNQCYQKLNTLREIIMHHNFEYNYIKLHVTVTIGMSEYPSGKSVQEWIHLADQKLYQGKSNGKNQVVI